MTVTTVKRYDRGELRGAKRTAQGYLRADGYLTRVGVFEYRELDGTVRREFRPPEEVFAIESLASFSLAPLTLLHPAEPLTPENTRAFQVGTIGETVSREELFVRAPVVVQDAAAIKAAESGEAQELSCGYSAELEMTAGEWQGERYDAIQRQIRGNHVALVPRGRAGPEVRLRLDAADAEQVHTEPPVGGDTSGQEPAPTGGSMPTKMKIDGITCEVSEQAAEAIARADAKHEAELKARDEQMASLKADAEKARSDAAEKAKAAQAEADKEKARADALQAEKEKADKARADAESQLPALVKARVALESKARTVLGAETKLDELDELGIKRAVVAKLQPDAKLDGASEAYVQARYDIAIEAAAKAGQRNPSLERARADAEAAGRETRADADAARKAMIERNRSAWSPEQK